MVTALPGEDFVWRTRCLTKTEEPCKKNAPLNAFAYHIHVRRWANHYNPLLPSLPSPYCHAPISADSDTAACITRGMSSCKPNGSETTQATCGCRRAAAFMRAGMSEVTCLPGLRKKGCRIILSAPASTQRSNACSILGSASSICAAFMYEWIRNTSSGRRVETRRRRRIGQRMYEGAFCTGQKIIWTWKAL